MILGKKQENMKREEIQKKEYEREQQLHNSTVGFLHRDISLEDMIDTLNRLWNAEAYPGGNMDQRPKEYYRSQCERKIIWIIIGAAIHTHFPGKDGFKLFKLFSRRARKWSEKKTDTKWYNSLKFKWMEFKKYRKRPASIHRLKQFLHDPSTMAAIGTLKK